MFAFSNCMPSEESSPSGSAKIRNALVEARCAQSDQLVPLFTADRAALGAEQKNSFQLIFALSHQVVGNTEN